jgi:hypothetical protein
MITAEKILEPKMKISKPTLIAVPFEIGEGK